MWPFKKDKVIDLTGKQLKVPIPASTTNSFSETDYKDLTSSSSGSENASGLGFLGSMAGAASDSTETEGSLGLSRSNPQHLKVKMEDIEYKVESLRKKIDSVLDRLDLAEKKIDRGMRS